MKRILIGVAWPYANGPIHIGQVGGCYLPPDIFKRFHELKGNDVLMVSGSDQHGTPVSIEAEEEGISSRELAEKYHRINTQALKDLGVDFTLFTYTMHPTHKRVSKDLFKTLYEKGHVYLDTMETYYCDKCERFLPDRYVMGKCPNCGQEEIRSDQCDECGLLLDPEDVLEPMCMFCNETPELKESEHFFLKLSAFQEALEEYIEDKDHWKNHVLNFTKGWLEEGLEDRPISRDMKWGIDIPIEGYEDKRIYVWFEAVIGYLSTAIQWSENTDGDWEKFWKDDDTRHYYFLAKDNIPFHTIIWPAMLMGYDEDLNLPYNVPANQYMLLGGKQFSTSRGRIVSLPDVLEDFDPDAIRYYITSIMPENKDTNFTWEDFEKKNNSELVGNLGNFIHRVLSFTYSNFGEIPERGDLEDRDRRALEICERKIEKINESLSRCRFKEGLVALLEISKEGNRYFNDKEPWKQIKSDEIGCKTTLHVALKIVKAVSIVGSPYLPHTMKELRDYLGIDKDRSELDWEDSLEPLETGRALEEPEPLYKNIDLDEIFSGDEIMEWMKRLDLRVGKIVSIEEHPNADKLYITKVDLGEEEKTLVAGLKPYYDREEMKGKKIVVVANLEPAKLRGIKSEGMMLAAQEDETVSLLIPSGEIGEQILGTERGADQISFDDFQEFDFKTAEMRGDKVFTGEEIEADNLEGKGDTAVFIKDDRAFILRDSVGPVSTDREVSPGSQIL